MASFRSTKTHFKNLSRRFLEGEVIEERGAAAEAEDELYRLVPSDNEDGDDDDVDRDGRRETVVQYYNQQELGNGDTIKATIENTPNKRKKSLRKRVSWGDVRCTMYVTLVKSCRIWFLLGKM